ncbi:hypothetical protein ABI36_0213485 [Pseudomonas aeruginosa]|nr:hypothetical protein ABI36_0213485 [Pseudomonas aeruginosa]
MATPAYMSITGTKQGLITAGAFTEDSVGNTYQAKSCAIFSVLPMRIASEFLASPNNALMEKSFKTSGTVLV